MSVSTPADVSVSPLRRWLREHPRLRGAMLDLIALGRMLLRPRKLLATIRYRLRLGHCGKGVDFESDMVVRNPRKISIGDRCSFSPFVVLDAHDCITIGDDCMFATRVTVSTATHDYSVEPMNRKVTTRPVTIESGVWLGVAATILPGVRIGRGAVVGAHALVTKDVPPYAIVLGVPARVVRYRDVPQEGR